MGTRGFFTVLALVLASGLLVSGAEKDCTFLKNPDEFRLTSERTYRMRSDLTSRLAMSVYAAPIDPIDEGGGSRHKNNLIDDYIFSRMASAGIQPAPLASDAEFLRRVSL